MAARRQHRREERWLATRTNEDVPALRVRGRTLPSRDAASLADNTYDDTFYDAAEVAAAERLIEAQAASPAASAAEPTARWDLHYDQNQRNYHDRRYLLNEFPALAAAAQSGAEHVVLEAGCGTGNSIFPLAAAAPQFRLVGCDLSASAVRLADARLRREGLAHRARVFVWDVSAPPPQADLGQLPMASLALAIFTLSALAPGALPRAMANLHACLLPGGRLLLRDYGRLDLKQLKFASAGGRLPDADGWEWYARGDGTTVVFFSEARVRALAAASGFEVESIKYDKRLVVNRASGERMQRVWVSATLRKPGPAPAESSRGGPAATRWRRLVCARRSARELGPMAGAALVLAAAAAATLVVVALVRGLTPRWRRLVLPRVMTASSLGLVES